MASAWRGSPVSTPSSSYLPFVHRDSLHQYADYPAILPCERSKALLGRELTSEENSVRGTLVSGLTAQDITLLDVFEGDARI